MKKSTIIGRWAILAALLLVKGAGAEFNPPRITEAVHGTDRGSGSTEERLYYIDKGLESNISEGNILNIYREINRGGVRPVRFYIGTMVIVDAQAGLSIGRFTPNPDIMSMPMIRYKTALKNDLAIPRLVINASILFDPGKADLKPGVAEEFKKIGDFVQNLAPSKLVIEGHTDSDGDEKDNYKLSETRAQVVRQYLINAYKFIAPAMIDAKGFGETRPFVNNDTPENKALNRRIEIVVWE